MDDEKNAKALRGRAKGALTRIENFIKNKNEVFEKNDICNKLEKIQNIYNEFDSAECKALPGIIRNERI